MIDQARFDIEDVYLNSDKIIDCAYSGGKDSTLLLQLFLEVAEKHNFSRPINVHYADTLICDEKRTESALNVGKALSKITNVAFTVVRPDSRQTFFSEICGRGYGAPTWLRRWCTSRLKTKPATRYFQALAADKPIRRPIEPMIISAVGLRSDESPKRSRLLNVVKPNRFATFGYTKKVLEYFPIRDVSTPETIEYLKKVGKFVWGETFDDLLDKYPNGFNDASSRDGCLFCTLPAEYNVAKNRNDAGKPTQAFRVLLRNMSDDPRKRRVPTSEKTLAKIERGEPSGLFTIEARKELFAAVKEMEAKMARRFISEEEETFIRNCWDEQKSL